MKLPIVTVPRSAPPPTMPPDHPVSLVHTRNQVMFWVCVFALVMGLVYLFEGIILPFVLGTAIAYLLDPVVKAMRRRNIPRWAAALLMIGSFALFVTLALIFLLPLAYREIAQLINDLPSIFQKIDGISQRYSRILQERFHTKGLPSLQEAFKSNMATAVSAGGSLMLGIVTGGKAILNVLYVVVLTPIVAYLMMNDWPRMKRWLDDMVPRRGHDVVGQLWHEIDVKLSGFIRGQLILSFLLGVIYSIALTIAGLNYGFLIGVAVGIGSLVPLVGSTTGLIVSLAVAWFQNHDLSYVAVIAGIFFASQFVETNILTPRLLGKSVGLHPLWILFALLAGAELAGIVGMLVAVPLAATIGVLVGYAIRKYKKSTFYVPEEVPLPPYHSPDAPPGLMP